MKKQIITIMFLLSFALVSGLYAGESISFETELINPKFVVVGNSSDLIGMNISFEDGNITISTVINFKPDNFTIIFFDEKTKGVEKIVYSSGEGGWGAPPIKDKDINITNDAILIDNKKINISTPTNTTTIDIPNKDSNLKYIIGILFIATTVILGFLWWLNRGSMN